MKHIHSIPHLLCLSIVAMGCPTVRGGSTLKPEASTRNDRNDRDNFDPKRRKISGSTDCPEQGPKQNPEQSPQQGPEQNPEQANSSRKASKAVTENEESKEETTPGTCDTHALAATSANPSNAGSNTGTGSPTSSCSPSKKSPVVAQLTASSIGLPTLIQGPLSTLPNGVLLQDLEKVQAQNAATKAQEAVNNPQEAAKKAVNKAKQAAVSYEALIKIRCEKLNSAKEISDLAKSDEEGIKDLQTKIRQAQALVEQLKELKADDRQVQSFKEALNQASTTLQNAHTQVQNKVKIMQKRFGS